MAHEQSDAPERAPRQSLEDAAADALPPGSYWEAHRFIGAVPLSAESRVHLNAVRKEGTWYLRLRAYRRARGGGETWIPARQILIFPPEAVPVLRELLGDADATLDALSSAGLTTDELDAQTGSTMPEREALSLIRPDLLDLPPAAP